MLHLALVWAHVVLLALLVNVGQGLGKLLAHDVLHMVAFAAAFCIVCRFRCGCCHCFCLYACVIYYPLLLLRLRLRLRLSF